MIRILLLVCSFLWIFPAVTQYKTPYFKFFLILAVCTIVSIVLIFSHQLTLALYFYLPASFCLPFTLLQKKTIIKLKYFFILLGGILLYTLLDHAHYKHEFELMMFLDSITLVILLSTFVMDAITQRSLNIFLLVLVLYALSLIIRSFYAIVGTPLAIYNFFVSDVFELLVCLFFIFFKESSPSLRIKIRIHE